MVDSQPKTRMWYRINATRNMTGGRKIQPSLKMNDKLKEVRANQSTAVLCLTLPFLMLTNVYTVSVSFKGESR